MSSGIRAGKPSSSPHDGREISIPVPPFKLSANNQKLLQEKYTGILTVSAKKHNKRVKANLAQLSLNSSTGGELLGGTCSSEMGLAGVLKRYCIETFAEDVVRSAGGETIHEFSWRNVSKRLIAISGHRTMRRADSCIVPRPYCDFSGFEGRDTCFESYVRHLDHLTVMSGMAYECNALVNKTKSLRGILDHLENLHHPSIPFVEGLTVELLEFQRQSVQWALERETTPGGIQSFLWGKLPSVADPGQEVYYNPILERFRRDKPLQVRGGIISDEMGLGKTIISLSLILENPAPTLPQSGSPVTALNFNDSASVSALDVETQPLWDKDLYSRTSAVNSKRGSIISRGTLVVVRKRYLVACQ